MSGVGGLHVTQGGSPAAHTSLWGSAGPPHRSSWASPCSSHWTVVAGEGCTLPCTPVGPWARRGRAGLGSVCPGQGMRGHPCSGLPGPLCVLWLSLVPDPGAQPRIPSAECHSTVTDWSGGHGKVGTDSPVPTQQSLRAQDIITNKNIVMSREGYVALRGFLSHFM